MAYWIIKMSVTKLFLCAKCVCFCFSAYVGKAMETDEAEGEGALDSSMLCICILTPLLPPHACLSAKS